MYQIRHKMIHKAIRLPIDMVLLTEFQMTAVEAIKTLCTLNKTIADKSTLIEYLEQEK